MAKWSLAGINGQEEQRRVETFVDQHGREYVTNVEISTGDPCSALQPFEGWVAPLGPDWFRGLLMPPEHLRQMVPRMERARKRYQIHINYTQWLAEHDDRDDHWQRRLEDLAQRATKGVDFVSMVENPPTAMLDYMGPKAFPPREFIEAMAAGDAWALGLSDRIPAKAQGFLKAIEYQVKKTRTRVRRAESEIVNPFADDDDEDEIRGDDGLAGADGLAGTNPLEDTDALDDLDEMFDPQASGGKTEKKGRRPRVER